MSYAFANIIGNPVHNFNPHHSQSDFITSHSSQTLPQNKFNAVYFIDYARNSLFSLTNEKPNDDNYHSTFALGYGVTKNWDIGFVMPYILHQNIRDHGGVGRFEEHGLIAFRVSSKYRIRKYRNGGVALVANLGFNRTEGFPFYGDKMGSSLGAELVVDRAWQRWLGAVNVGYRTFNSGQQIPGFTAFEPFKSAWLMTLAGRYQLTPNWFVVSETWGSIYDSEFASNFSRSNKAFEALAGGLYKDSWGNNTLNLAFGLTTKLNDGLSTPDIRAFAGASLIFGVKFKPRKNFKKGNVYSGSDDILSEYESEETSSDSNESSASIDKIKVDSSSEKTESQSVESQTKVSKEKAKDVQIEEKQNIETQDIVSKDLETVDQKQTEQLIKVEDQSSYKSADIHESSKESDEYKIGLDSKTNDAKHSKEVKDPKNLEDKSSNEKEIQTVESVEDRDPSSVLSNVENVVMSEINFSFDSTKIKPDSIPALKQFADTLKSEGFDKLIIEGHTDSTGPENYNLRLSQKRAETILNYLRSEGVDVTKIEIKGYGESNPLVPNTNLQNRAQNRRVEFKIQR